MRQWKLGHSVNYSLAKSTQQ